MELSKEIIRKNNALKRLNLWASKCPWCHSYYDASYRCNNPKHPAYEYYGGKGVKLLMSMDDFGFLWKRDKAWLMKSPSIDRIDSNGNYEISNCRFIERRENFIRSAKGCSERKRVAILKNSLNTRFKKKIGRKLELNWCIKHQRVHIKFPNHRSCKFPNRIVLLDVHNWENELCPCCNKKGLELAKKVVKIHCVFCNKYFSLNSSKL